MSILRYIHWYKKDVYLYKLITIIFSGKWQNKYTRLHARYISYCLHFYIYQHHYFRPQYPLLCPQYWLLPWCVHFPECAHDFLGCLATMMNFWKGCFQPHPPQPILRRCMLLIQPVSAGSNKSPGSPSFFVARPVEFSAVVLGVVTFFWTTVDIVASWGWVWLLFCKIVVVVVEFVGSEDPFGKLSRNSEYMMVEQRFF